MDEMFFNDEGTSLRRGKRRDKRTPTLRPCLVSVDDGLGPPMQGVVLDINRYGLRVRMLDQLAPGTRINVQLMQDERFREPVSAPLYGEVARIVPDGNGFTDHGIKILHKRIQREISRPVSIPARQPRTAPRRSRMHTLDVTVDDRGYRRR